MTEIPVRPRPAVIRPREYNTDRFQLTDAGRIASIKRTPKRTELLETAARRELTGMTGGTVIDQIVREGLIDGRTYRLTRFGFVVLEAWRRADGHPNPGEGLALTREEIDAENVTITLTVAAWRAIAAGDPNETDNLRDLVATKLERIAT